ncbi:MAG TPA: SIMPL domain-containing protein [Chitinophagaceae bacterium]|nr:SIMPL domain-containing protein [Chitinophagaceae bacterium]
MKSALAVAIAALGLIIAVFFICNAYKYKFKATENIVVTGGAEKDFVSDQIVWTGNYSRKMLDLKAAYAVLKEDEAKIKAYLTGKGLAASEMVFSAISIDKDFSYRYDENGRQIGSEFTGYNLRQNVTVDSKDIDKVEKISREVTELIESGIEFNSSAPSYYYTKLSELKIDLLAKATADAKLRAETIAKNSGSSLGATRKATMGVFQITGQNSNEDYSYGGVFNTSNKNKTASITVRMEYAAN